MKIKYEIDIDDFFVFSDHLMKTSTLMLRTIRKGQLWWAGGPLVGGLAVSILNGASTEKTLAVLSVLSVVVSLPMFFLYPYYFRYCNKKNIIKSSENDSYKGILGTHEMTISDEHLSDKTEHGDNKVPWDSISNIETTSEHTFVFTSEITAYIIPHKKIMTGNSAQFINLLDDVYKKVAG